MKKQFPLLLMGILTVIILFLASLSTGSLLIPIDTVWSALFGSHSSDHELIISSVRLPRTLIALVVGAGMAVAGVCMQALTRNPLASPELLGINQGAALAVVISLFLLPGSALWVSHAFAFMGAALAAGFILLLSSVGGKRLTPLKVVVAGTAVSLMLGSTTQGVLLLNERSIDEMRFWLAGSVAGKGLPQLFQGMPFIFIGMIGALLLGKRMNALQLGDDVSVGIGMKSEATKRLLFVLIILLSASCVTISGPIAFVGFAVPHMVRGLCGTDYRWIVLHSSLLGAALLLLADVASKIIIHPGEVPIGIMTIFMGAPFFIYLARKKEWRLG
ncbi:iron ABC transporter permease [Paenibacillus sp. J22TS3]|uniref:FecCD family ABC transporter permease n=1 Tax=Paenibacillus sp. J22TS3 TaxID=2807192 RepID=UPI001B1AE5EE|nr:iron ABC transporter permease [Paenibacillus sp. J22TS3]GIP23236.1 siderophore ABC transporter permease [Paenibacillus sp. J22TS3]